MGGKFAWVRPDVYPLIAAVSVGCGFGLYIISRKMFFDPSVELSRMQRQEAVKPEYAHFNEKAQSYKSSAIFQTISKIRGPHFYTDGEITATKA